MKSPDRHIVLDNYRPDSHDGRDLHYSLHGPKVASLPDVVDLSTSPFTSKVKDQGQEGSCTANALAAAVEFEMRRNGHACPDLSRQFLYRGERTIEGTVRSDSGAEIRDGVKFLAKVGVPPEAMWPYDKAHFSKAPPPDVVAAAAPFRIKDYLRLTTKDDMLHCLASGFPFVVGVQLYESFESDEVARTGIVPMPKPGEKCIGGHAILRNKYNLPKQSIGGPNSWNTTWGQLGYMDFPFAYMFNPKLVTDFWMLRA